MLMSNSLTAFLALFCVCVCVCALFVLLSLLLSFLESWEVLEEVEVKKEEASSKK